MVEKRTKERKKRKRKQARPSQTISQKVIVNLGKGYSTKRRTGTQNKRSVQPQVVYQPAAVPVQANQQDVLTRLNDFRDEVKVQRQHDVEGHRRQAADLMRMMNLQRAEGEQRTAVQTERQDAPPAVAEAKAPAKRSGRPKGSKNRPKPTEFETQVPTPDVEERGVSPMLRSSSAPEFQPVGQPKQSSEPRPREFPRTPIPRGVRLIQSRKGTFEVIPADQPTIEEGFGIEQSGKPLSFA